ncbi:MAG: AAA family ATPase [Anaerolineae bacterium]|jgi:predicted ATPase|nr:AAA family ATPase [Anaerolineae bacterium]
MYPLDRIQIKGYKSIKAIDLELRPLNVLLGANGAGKSNFLSVFKLGVATLGFELMQPHQA